MVQRIDDMLETGVPRINSFMRLCTLKLRCYTVVLLTCSCVTHQLSPLLSILSASCRLLGESLIVAKVSASGMSPQTWSKQ